MEIQNFNTSPDTPQPVSIIFDALQQYAIKKRPITEPRPISASDITTYADRISRERVADEVFNQRVGLYQEGIDTLTQRLLKGEMQPSDFNIALARIIADKERLADHDTLTGLLNQGGWHRRLAEMTVNFPDDEILIVIMDLDGLKDINDREGHEAGNQYIKKGANALAKFFKNLGRIGGDEFAAAERGLTLEDLKAKWKLVQDALAQNSISLSAGVSSFRGSAIKAIVGALHQADARMYQSKASYYKDSGKSNLLETEGNGLEKEPERPKQNE